MTAYSIERYEEKHKRQVAQLQRQLWGLSPANNRKYLEWKYENNPYTLDVLIYVALHLGRVIGMRGMFGAMWEVGGRTPMVIPSAADSLVDREHRNTRVFNKLTEVAFNDLRDRGYSHVLNLSPTPANYVTSVVTMGWRPIGSVRMVRPRSRMPDMKAGVQSRFPQHEIATRLLRSGRRVRAALWKNGLSHFDRQVARSRNVVRIPALARDPRPSAMADLISRMGHGDRIRHVRDHKYFEWRFRNPRANYRYIFWDRSGTLDGYLVLGNLIGQSRVFIADWEATNSEVLAGLLEAAMAASGSRPNLQTWSATLATERIKLLEQAGFEMAPTRSRHTGRLIVKRLNRAGTETGESSLTRDLEDIQRWDLRMIYSDGL